MPSDRTGAEGDGITGRCYCGGLRFSAPRPELVTYCHCSDCKRATGAPVAAFAAFDVGDFTVMPGLPAPVSVTDGVRRWFCRDCGSPVAATYDYLPGMVYVPLGLIDQADALAPQMHAHAGSRFHWMDAGIDLPSHDGSARDRLNARSGS